MISVSVYTLGCKLNQLESEAVAGAFLQAGFPIFPLNEDEPADLVVINTCTVTSKAEQKARRIIRKLVRNNASCVVVSGCYAQMEAGAIAAIDKRVVVVTGERKSGLLDLPKALMLRQGGGDPPLRDGIFHCENDSAFLSKIINDLLNSPDIFDDKPLLSNKSNKSKKFRYNPDTFSFHSRAFLKIQDGCNRRCAYCRVSIARGTSVSLEAEQVLAQLRTLEANGYNEAVLTGVNINQYNSGMDLAGLLDFLLKGTERVRIRLSSIEPEGITEEFCKILPNKRICPHFHLSVQSGSNAVLEKMKRPYTREIVEQGVRLLRAVKDDPFLGCDIIAGFPGETPACFEETRDLCARTGFAWIHAFPYSPRPGTEAYGYKEKVAEREIFHRIDALLALAKEGRRTYVKRQIGKPAEAVIETNGNAPQGYAAGITETYLKILIKIEEGSVIPEAGSLVQCIPVDFADSADGCVRDGGFDMPGEMKGRRNEEPRRKRRDIFVP
jgi:threonylcarbamoyladenosine tRNA methylthiotransferase MtaB